MEYIQHHVTAKPIPLSQRVPGKTFPPLLEQVMDRALAKRPEDRFASAADFAAAMSAVLAGATELPPSLEPSATLDSKPTVRVASVPTPPPIVQGSSTAPGGTTRRPVAMKTNWGLVAGVATLCLILGAVATIVFMKLAMR